MGKWNHRRTWRPKNYYRDQRFPTPPTYYDTEFKFRGAWRNNNLPWEERFCLSVGIPWEKIVNAKKYIDSYDNVLKWNDSACETSFFEAKERFWDKINNIHHDVPPLDPDMYNKEIDWNPNIDLDLVKDLDRAYFNPDEAKVENYNATNRNDGYAPGCILGLDDNKNGNYGWQSSNKSVNKNISDPWEREVTQDDNREIKDTWGGGENSSWQKDTTWGDGARNSRNNEISWGGNATNSWHWNQYNKGPTSRQTGNYMDTSFGRGQHNRQGGQRYNESGWGTNNSCRKREGEQYTRNYKSARVQYDDYREGNQYRRR